MIVYVSLFGCLPAACSLEETDLVETASDLCEYVLGETLWDVSRFFVERATLIKQEWESDLQFHAGPSFASKKPIDGDAPLAEVPRGHVIFVHFLVVPRNITADDCMLMTHRTLPLPDACDMTAEHHAIVKQCTRGRTKGRFPHVISVQHRSGTFDLVVGPTWTMEHLMAVLCERTRCLMPSSCHLHAAGAAKPLLRTMKDVRSRSSVCLRVLPPHTHVH